MLAAQSSFKGKSDRNKYGKAMRLKGCIEKIRSDYKKNLGSKDAFNRQVTQTNRISPPRTPSTAW